jgi:hypothetical protein
MLSDYTSSWKNAMEAARTYVRRTAHGGSPWRSRPWAEMHQPQDSGADMDVPSRVMGASTYLTRDEFVGAEATYTAATTLSLVRPTVTERLVQKITPSTAQNSAARKDLRVA